MNKIKSVFIIVLAALLIFATSISIFAASDFNGRIKENPTDANGFTFKVDESGYNGEVKVTEYQWYRCDTDKVSENSRLFVSKTTSGMEIFIPQSSYFHFEAPEGSKEQVITIENKDFKKTYKVGGNNPLTLDAFIEKGAVYTVSIKGELTLENCTIYSPSLSEPLAANDDKTLVTGVLYSGYYMCKASFMNGETCDGSVMSVPCYFTAPALTSSVFSDINMLFLGFITLAIICFILGMLVARKRMNVGIK